ncbi:MAG: DUF3500 domain-containing protein [Burkholderiales bacterium]|nr:DUF3500 domain-containing protein [Burkholderiales bacterium]
MRAAIVLALAALVPLASAQPAPPATAAVAARMRVAAEQLLAALPEPAREKVARPFDDRDRVDWHYTPRSRNGVALKELDRKGRDAVHALLREALSAAGYRKVVNIIELELVLRELETFGLMRDPERYHLTVYGTPSRTAAWGWRFEGHHLSLNFTLAGDRMVVDTPSFLGANPATVPRGAAAGLRVLAAEEDEARVLLALLADAQRRMAVFDTRTYGDIVTTNAAKVDPPQPAGLAAADMTEAQRAQLVKLIDVYARTFEPALAEARMARVREGGIENVRFGWAGSTERGRPHYYRVQGPLFLIEYDASPNDGNHIHTVWRDFNGDFGRDLLRLHYARASGTTHRH